MERLTMSRDQIKDFACWDDRINKTGWHFAMVGGTHRDCDAIAISNAHVIEAWLSEVDPSQDHWGHLEASHWAVGWYRHLIVDPNYAPAMDVLRRAREKLDAYPILDEMHLSEVEMERHDGGRCDEHCSFCESERAS